jgi:Zn-dependent peptidase ImmA (M78 family)
MANLQVKGPVLAWARKERGLSAATAAKRLAWTEDALIAAEKAAHVTLKQSELRRMARAYKLPYGSLFMPTPLPPTKPPKYRSFRGKQSAKISEPTLLAWAEVNDAVESFAELKLATKALIPHHALSEITLRDDVENIASRERVRLGVTVAEQHVWTESQARNGWRSALGDVGVFIYFYQLPRRDCMGFAIIDERDVPAICVNDDPDLLEQQKIFTMLHEYCHLLLRRPGISDQADDNDVEKFCNRFAAALLVPRDALRAILPGGGPHRDWTTAELKRVANRFTVSMEVVARRIEELGLSSSGFHERKVKEWNRLGLLQKRRKKTHPNVTWPERTARRLGRKHTTTVFGALNAGAISYREASDMIGLAPKHFNDVKAAATG